MKNKGSKAAEDPNPKCLRCEKLFQGKKNLKVHILKMHEIDGEWTVDNLAKYRGPGGYNKF